MGPGREPKVCENDELVAEFEFACRSGDYEFAEEYKQEIIMRLKRGFEDAGNGREKSI